MFLCLVCSGDSREPLRIHFLQVAQGLFALNVISAMQKQREAVAIARATALAQAAARQAGLRNSSVGGPASASASASGIAPASAPGPAPHQVFLPVEDPDSVVRRPGVLSQAVEAAT